MNIYNTASVLKDSNRVICESKCDPSHLSSGSRIKFYLDPESYTIARIEELFYIVSFEVRSNGDLLIKDNVDINLVLGDVVDVSYKEYELDTKVNIIGAGSGYLVGDVLTIREGTPYTDVDTKIDKYSRLEISDTNEFGGVISLKVIDAGKYIKVPSEQVSFGHEPQGGKGSGLELVLIYKTINNRATISREIFEIGKDGDKYSVRLNHSLPKNIKEGKISVKKYQMFLSSNYASESKFNASYQLITDFTENYKFPYLIQGSLSAAAVYNEAITALDAKIKTLEDKIARLEDRG